jgi:hypothetical protein
MLCVVQKEGGWYKWACSVRARESNGPARDSIGPARESNGPARELHEAARESNGSALT